MYMYMCVYMWCEHFATISVWSSHTAEACERDHISIDKLASRVIKGLSEKVPKNLCVTEL
jgi:hypothetical protein